MQYNEMSEFRNAVKKWNAGWWGQKHRAKNTILNLIIKQKVKSFVELRMLLQTLEKRLIYQIQEAKKDEKLKKQLYNYEKLLHEYHLAAAELDDLAKALGEAKTKQKNSQKPEEQKKAA